MKVEILSTLESLESMQEEWQALHRVCGGDDPFLSYEWHYTTLRSFGAERRLHVAAFRRNAELVAVVPLWVEKAKLRRVRVTQLAFVGNPDTPYSDILGDPADPEVVEAIAGYLSREAARTADLVALKSWRFDSPWRRALTERIKALGTGLFQGVPTQAPYVPILGEWEAFLKERTRNFRRSRRGVLNRMARAGEAEIECLTADPEGISFERMLRVSERSWKVGAGIGLPNRPQVVSFLRGFTPVAGERGWLRLWFLKLNGRTIATEYQLVAGRKIYALRADFDEAYRKLSPGTYLEYEIVRRLFESGYEEYNSGPGLNEYKLRWTEDTRLSSTVYLESGTLLGRFTGTLERRVVPLLKAVKRAVRGERGDPVPPSVRMGKGNRE